MHMNTKVAQFSICHVHFTTFICPLSLLVLAALNLRAGAWVSHPSAAYAWISAGGWAAGLAEGCAGASTSMGGGLRGSFGLRLRGSLSLRLALKLSCLGGPLSRRFSVRFRVRLLFGLASLLTCSCSLLLLPMGHCSGMRGIQQMPLNPRHFLLPLVFHPRSPPRLPNNRDYNPKVDTIRVGHINLFTKHGPSDSSKRGVPGAAFAGAVASRLPPSCVHGALFGPTMCCCPIRRTCASSWGVFWVGWVLGAGQGGLDLSAGGGGGGGLCLGCAVGAREGNQQLDRRIS